MLGVVTMGVFSAIGIDASPFIEEWMGASANRIHARRARSVRIAMTSPVPASKVDAIDGTISGISTCGAKRWRRSTHHHVPQPSVARIIERCQLRCRRRA